MKLENQVISLELAKKLKEFGVKQESLFYYIRPLGSDCEFSIGRETERDDEIFSAFTVAELGEMFNVSGIGDFISHLLGADGWCCSCGYEMKNAKKQGIKEFEKTMYAKTEVDARAKMFIYLLENNLLTP